MDSRDVFIQELKSHPRFANQEIVLLNTAVGGYKQPQPLMVVSYLLALGAHFDAVINIDGFNDVDSVEVFRWQ